MARTGMTIGAAALAFTGAFALATVAEAQTTAPPPPATTTTGDTEVHTTANVQAGGGMRLPGAGRPATTNGDSDHDGVIGTFAIGYLGTTSLAVGCAGGELCNGGGGGGFPAGTFNVNTPIIGGRYWINELIGIDAGLGFGFDSHGGTGNHPSSDAFLIHGGVPLSLASAGHFSFEIIPEMNLGFAGWSLDVPNAPSISGSGVHFDIGARAGAEIQFGFIGIPQLALQGTIGLQLRIDSTKVSEGGASNKTSDTFFGTTVQQAPWEIFTSNIAALYYF